MMSYRRRVPLGDIGNTLNAGTPAASAAKDRLIPNKSFRGAISTFTAAGSSAPPSPPSPRFDERNRGDPQRVHEYAKEIIQHLLASEGAFRPSMYLSRQTTLTERMRVILVDWMVDVHNKFRLHPETLFLSVDLVDRFLDKRVVTRDHLQLAGVVAMLLAAKYQEIFPPDIEKFIYISASTYNREQVLSWERAMLTAVNFTLTVPTIWPFLKRGLEVIEADRVTECTARFFAELALVDYNLLQYKPSVVACACIFLANKSAGSAEPWNATLEHYLQTKVPQFEKCAEQLIETARASLQAKTQAVRKKYSTITYCQVSKNITEELLASLASN